MTEWRWIGWWMNGKVLEGKFSRKIIGSIKDGGLLILKCKFKSNLKWKLILNWKFMIINVYLIKFFIPLWNLILNRTSRGCCKKNVCTWQFFVDSIGKNGLEPRTNIGRTGAPDRLVRRTDLRLSPLSNLILGERSTDTVSQQVPGRYHIIKVCSVE